MAFRLKLGEALDDGIRRIATSQIDRAIAQIGATAGDAPVIAVHESRKCLKRGRALLRFARPLLDAGDFKHANGVLREVGRALSGTRDLDVVGQTIDGLRRDAGLKSATLTRLDKALAAARGTGTVPAMTDATRLELVDRLTELRARIAGLEIALGDAPLATAGLAESLDKCRKDFEHAFDADHDDAFHAWRKSVQLHWRHMQLVERAWPAYCQARREEARAISMLVGTDRDLAMLASFAAAQSLPKTMQREIAGLIERRRPTLRAEAHARGERLMAEGTAGFCRRLEQHWSAARRLRSASKAAEKAGAKPKADDGT